MPDAQTRSRVRAAGSRFADFRFADRQDAGRRLANGLASLGSERPTVRRKGPRKVILAVPVCSPEAASRLARDADEIVCLLQPAGFRGVGESYRDFAQLTDEDVLSLLAQARSADSAAPASIG